MAWIRATWPASPVCEAAASVPPIRAATVAQVRARIGDPVPEETQRAAQAIELTLGTETGEETRLICGYFACESLLLQPIVENAIKYAVTPQEEGAEICVRVQLAGERVRIVVSDTGPGLADARSRSTILPGLSTGVGLANIRERLVQAYGPNQRFETRTSPAGGFSVEIEIPFQLEDVNRVAA